jgi:hypothetical protein
VIVSYNHVSIVLWVLFKISRNVSGKKSRHTQSPNRHRPLGSIHNNPNVFATIRSCPQSPFVSASSTPSVIRP